MPIHYHMIHSSLPPCLCLLVNSHSNSRFQTVKGTLPSQDNWVDYFGRFQQMNCFIFKLPWIAAVLLLLPAKKMSRLSFSPTATWCVITAISPCLNILLKYMTKQFQVFVYHIVCFSWRRVWKRSTLFISNL